MGNDETVALTAFVVIALHHGLAVFQDESTKQLKQRVVRNLYPPAVFFLPGTWASSLHTFFPAFF